MGARLPPIRRVLAGLAAASLASGLAVLLLGPWLRVTELTWAGERFTPPDELARLLEGERGRSALAVDTAALEARLAAELPTVEAAEVEATLAGGLRATIVERAPTLVWRTPRLWLMVGDDGTLFASLPADGPLPADLAAMPSVVDVRFAAHLMRVGDVLEPGLVEAARRLAAVDPAALGSAGGELSLRLEAQYGFVLVSAEPAWRIAFGFHARDPHVAAADLGPQIDRQVAAVRTLFAAQAEAGIAWVDARNPGKVYFRAKG